MSEADARPNASTPTVSIRGRRVPYLDRWSIGRRDYFLLEQLGPRRSYRAFDPRSGPGGDHFLVQELRSGPALDQRLRVLRRLKHDAFPRCVEWQRRGDSTYVAMTWVDGLPLSRYFEHLRAGRRPPVAPGEAVRLIHGLANGLNRLHQSLQLAHGDLQPANLVLTSHPSRLVMIDFGSAWPVEVTARREEGDGRHPIYAAPELSQPKPVVGFHADQFSASVILYELLTGVIPYDGLGGKAGRAEFRQEAQTMLHAPCDKNPRCAGLPRSLREALNRVTLRGLALDPEERYPDRQAWLNELFALYAAFRLPPREPDRSGLLTRVAEWMRAFKRND